MRIIPVTEGRKRLGELIDIVKYQRSIIVLGKHGEAEALLIAIPGQSEDFSISEINAHSPSFAFLDTEPDLYSRSDLKPQYE